MTNIAQNISSALEQIYPKSEAQAIAYALVEHLTGWDRTYLFTHPEATPDSNTQQRLIVAQQRLLTNEPIQYIIGITQFCSLTFRTDHRALIPRPETEELVAWALENQHHNILDIGTGTGCIAISLAHHLPSAHVTAFDISEEALSLAKENARDLHTDVTFIHQDILHPKPWTGELFDLIISNPPYITEQEKAEMERNVLDFEPHTALFVPNEDPLLFYRAIAHYARNYLTSGGSLMFEINQYLANETVALLRDEGFQEVVLRNDINGNPRMIMAVNP